MVNIECDWSKILVDYGGWWVHDVTKDAPREFYRFETEFSAQMFAAGVHGLLFRGYGLIGRDQYGKDTFQKLPSP